MKRIIFVIASCICVNTVAFAEYDSIPYFTGANVITYAPELTGQGGKEFDLEEASKSLARLREDGVGYIEIVLRGRMKYPMAVTITPDPNGLTDEELIALISAAKKENIVPILKPHIIVSGGRENCWDIGGNWGENARQIEEKWFEGYRNYIMRYIKISSNEKLPFFVIATELPQLAADNQYTGSRHEDAWRALVKEIRKNYNGKLTYAANSTSAAAIKWWDALDYIGIDGYFTLTKTDEPDLKTIKEGWIKNKIQKTCASFGKTARERQEGINIVSELEGLSKEFQRPVVFTEIGYRSADGAASNVVDGSRQWRNAAENQELQANLYRAMFEVLRDKPWFKGAFFWGWYLGRVDRNKAVYRTSHMIEGKKAEEVIQEEYLTAR